MVDRLRDEVADVVVVERIDDAVAVSFASDETKVAKQAELMRDRRLLELDVGCEIADRAGRLSQPRQDADAARSGERLHRLRDLVRDLSVKRRERQGLVVTVQMSHTPIVPSEDLFM